MSHFAIDNLRINYRNSGIIFFLLLTQFSSNIEATAQSITNSTDADTTKQQMPARDILTGNSTEAKLFAVRKYDFIQNASSTFSSSNNDTSLVFELNTRIHPFLFLTPEQLHDFTPVGPDPLGDELRRKFNDIPPTVSLSQLFRSLVQNSKKTKKRLSISEIPIPTNLEIDILKILWTQSLATASDVYAKLDPTWPITSEDLHAILEDMTNRGFLDRKKISPSHEFSLFGFAQIEMSSKNRKNKVYLYWPIVPKEKLITYLDAKRYLAYDATQKRSSNGESNQYYKILEDKLIRLVK